MVKKVLALSKNGQEVFLDDTKTNVHLHIQENPNLLRVAAEAIARQVLGDELQIVFEQDMGRIVGTTSLVKTAPGDEIVYAKRKGRDKYSRFVKGKSLRETSWVVVVVRKEGERLILWTAWCGRLLPPEAYAKDTYEPGGFWANHALVYDESLIQEQTIRR